MNFYPHLTRHYPTNLAPRYAKDAGIGQVPKYGKSDIVSLTIDTDQRTISAVVWKGANHEEMVDLGVVFENIEEGPYCFAMIACRGASITILDHSTS